MISYMRKHQQKEEDSAFIAHIESGGRAADFRFRPPAEGKEDMAEVEKSKAGSEAARAFGKGKEVKAHHLLVLLLRLRQVRSGEGFIGRIC